MHHRLIIRRCLRTQSHSLTTSKRPSTFSALLTTPAPAAANKNGGKRSNSQPIKPHIVGGHQPAAVPTPNDIYLELPDLDCLKEVAGKSHLQFSDCSSYLTFILRSASVVSVEDWDVLLEEVTDTLPAGKYSTGFFLARAQV